MRRKQAFIALGIVIAAAAAGALVSLWQRARPPVRDAAPRAAYLPASEITLPAHIRAQTIVPVGVPVPGAVESLLVEVGQEVTEGQLLGRIRNTGLDTDERNAATEFERAQARQEALDNQLIVARADASRARSEASRAQLAFDRAERAYSRQQTLVKEGATPRLAFESSAKAHEEARAARDTAADLARGAGDRLAVLVKTLDAARRSVEEQAQSLDRAKQAAAAADIYAPAAGLVVGCTRQAGEEVTPDVRDLFQIATDLSALEAVLQPDAAALARIRIGQEALITVAAAPDAISAQVSDIKGNEVIVRFVSPTPAVRPGITAQVRIKVT